jgi:hypothetical protein
MAIARGLVVTGLAVWALSAGTGAVTADDDGKKVAIRDDCDPDDPAYDATDGCTLEEGDVTFAEFFAESGPTSGPKAASVPLRSASHRRRPRLTCLQVKRRRSVDSAKAITASSAASTPGCVRSSR